MRTSAHQHSLDLGQGKRLGEDELPGQHHCAVSGSDRARELCWGCFRCCGGGEESTLRKDKKSERNADGDRVGDASQCQLISSLSPLCQT